MRMRIISGTLKGRVIEAPKGHKTHPMSEKIRGAVFNALGDLSGLSVLDAFAGSAALSIEATSHGADHAIAIEIDKKAHAVAMQNIADCGVSEYIKCIRANVSSWSDNNSNATFDVVILDPPYDKFNNTLINKLINKHVVGNGMIVLSKPPKIPFELPSDCKLVQSKNYGDAELLFMRKV